MQALISADVTSDVNKFSYQSNIVTNLTTDVSVDNNTAPGLSNLMNNRNTYVNALTDFTASQPAITSVTPSTTSPAVGGSLSITANVTNTTTSSVYLGYLSASNAIFVKVQMFDDGAHNDGAASDNVYGTTITVNDVTTQYYIYAENTNVGKFSPERAEHEFYSINATYPTITAGQLVVNEIMASNAITVTDASGKYEDWFELYNNTDTTLSLDNLYASDSQTNLLKWQFPAGTIIAPHSYLIVWADSDLTEEGLHADFKFSASGENCILSYPDGTIVDNVSFGAQTTDMSYARNPNGTGSFVIQTPTFNTNNETLSTSQFENFNNSLKIYPNPTNSILNVTSDEFFIDNIQVVNLQGQILYQNKYINQNNIALDVSSFSNGMYIVKVNNQTNYKIIKK